MYSGRVQCTKWDADFTFLSNMIDIIEGANSIGWIRTTRMHMAMIYFKNVRRFGKGPKNLYK